MDLLPVHWVVPLVQSQLMALEPRAPHAGHGGADVLVSEGAGTAAARQHAQPPGSRAPRESHQPQAVMSACVPTSARAQLAQGDPDMQSRGLPCQLTPDLLTAQAHREGQLYLRVDETH